MDSDKMTGLKEDIDHLLNAFCETQNIRFQMFAEEWKKLNFSFIYYGELTFREKKEAMQEAFYISMQYFLPPYDLQRRVGALYTLYGLYITQPHVPKFKIRVSLEQWQHIKVMLESLESQGHLDAIYVFHKLKTCRAFIISAMSKRMVFHNCCTEMKPSQNPTERWLDLHKNSLMTECLDESTLQLHHGLHDDYQNMKVKLGLLDNTSMMVVKDSITEYIVKRVEQMEATLEASNLEEKSSNDGDDDYNDYNDYNNEDDDESGSADQDRSSKLNKIKSRSYSRVAKASRSRRHRQQAESTHSKEDVSTNKTTAAKSKRQKEQKAVKKNVFSKSPEKTSSSDEDSQDDEWTPSTSKRTKIVLPLRQPVILLTHLEEDVELMREHKNEVNESLTAKSVILTIDKKDEVETNTTTDASTSNKNEPTQVKNTAKGKTSSMADCQTAQVTTESPPGQLRSQPTRFSKRKAAAITKDNLLMTSMQLRDDQEGDDQDNTHVKMTREQETKGAAVSTETNKASRSQRVRTSRAVYKEDHSVEDAASTHEDKLAQQLTSEERSPCKSKQPLSHSTSPKRGNRFVKRRGGGVKARTRGARQNVSN